MSAETNDLIEQIKQHAEANNDLKLFRLVNQLSAALQEGAGTAAGSVDHTTVGSVTGSAGVAIGRGAEAHVNQSRDASTVHVIFRDIYEQIGELAEEDETVTPEVVEEAQIEVARLEAEALKGEHADAQALMERFKNLANMREDILDVVTATLLSPAAGLAMVVKKIAQKAREEAGLPAV
jgi:hypothetical protein